MNNTIHIWEQKGLGKAPFTVVGFVTINSSEEAQNANYLENENTFEDYHYGQCKVCGIGLRNNYLIDSADGKHFSVGCDCVQSSGDGGLIDDVKKVQRTRHQLKKAHERALRREQWQREAEEKLVVFYADNQDVCMSLFTYSGRNTFIKDIASKLLQWGSISDGQVNAVVKALERDAIQAEEERTAEPVPVTEKRVQISGVVLSVKFVDNIYGGCTKILVKDDRGFKVWGSHPTIPSENNSYIHLAAGDKMSFMAKIERSKDDKFFGFFKRPTKCEVI